MGSFATAIQDGVSDLVVKVCRLLFFFCLTSFSPFPKPMESYTFFLSANSHLASHQGPNQTLGGSSVIGTPQFCFLY